MGRTTSVSGLSLGVWVSCVFNHMCVISMYSGKNMVFMSKRCDDSVILIILFYLRTPT